MKKFLKKFALIISTSTTLILAVYMAMYLSSSHVTGLAGEVFYVIEKAGHNSGHPAVILGDSVCNQVFPQREDSENITHLGCNQAITPAGTFLLLKKYLEHNPQTQEVFYIVLPGTISNNMNLNYTYQYFVIPFMNGENVNFIEEETRQELYEKFGKFFVENGYIKNFLLNNNFFMDKYISYIRKKQEKRYAHRISRAGEIYLAKIRELCREHNAELHILPLPMADVPKNYGWDDFRNDISAYGFDDIFGDFIERIHYYPEDWFGDGVHFKKEILEQHIGEIRNKIMNSPAQ